MILLAIVVVPALLNASVRFAEPRLKFWVVPEPKVKPVEIEDRPNVALPEMVKLFETVMADTPAMKSDDPSAIVMVLAVPSALVAASMIPPPAMVAFPLNAELFANPKVRNPEPSFTKVPPAEEESVPEMVVFEVVFVVREPVPMAMDVSAEEDKAPTVSEKPARLKLPDVTVISEELAIAFDAPKARVPPLITVAPV